MLSLTREIGQQIEERLRSRARPQDLALAMSFMRYTNSQRPTVVMDSESILANNPGLPYVDVTSHVLLWELLNSHDWSSSGTLRLQPDDTSVEVIARRVLDGPRAHYVLHFADLAQFASRAIAQTPKLDARPQIPVRPVHAVRVVDGPAGSGRSTAVGSIRENPLHDKPCEEILVESGHATGGREQAQRLLGEGTDVVLRRAENITAADADLLAELLAEHRRASSTGERASALFVTVDRARRATPVLAVLDEIGYAATVQALVSTPERIPGLVKQVLDRVDPGGRHTMSPAALQSFVQWSWPGNMTELVETLSTLVTQVPSSVIERKHLPRHLQQAPPRRRMSLLETAERDAIIKALDAASGNKSEAADLLGMGRTTLYRKLRQLGLDTGESSLSGPSPARQGHQGSTADASRRAVPDSCRRVARRHADRTSPLADTGSSSGMNTTCGSVSCVPPTPGQVAADLRADQCQGGLCVRGYLARHRRRTRRLVPGAQRSGSTDPHAEAARRRTPRPAGTSTTGGSPASAWVSGTATTSESCMTIFATTSAGMTSQRPRAISVSPANNRFIAGCAKF